MAAREISFYSGNFSQIAIDTDVMLALPIVYPGRRAIQIYKVEMEVDAAVFFGVVATWSSRMSFEIANDPVFDDESTIVITSKSMCMQGGVGVMDYGIDWLAPPGLIAVRKFMKMKLETYNTGIATSIKYRVYYKPKEVKDITALQLQIGQS
jgi:hypothetical protein